MLKLVIAEDEPLILENLTKKIGSLALDVEIVGMAKNGEDALELVRRHRPHLLMTDIRMPVMDGLELIERAQAAQPGLLCLILSGYDEFSYAQKAIRLNVSDYLLKPVKLHQLEQALRKLTGQLAQSRAIQQRDIIYNSYLGKAQAAPSAYPDAAFGMCLICVGALQTNAVAVRKGAENYPWLEAALKPLLPSENEWWLIDEAAPNCKMLIWVEHARLSVEALYMCLRDREERITFCHTAAPLPYAEIWKTGQSLRNTLRQGLTPFQSACLQMGAPAATGDLRAVEQARNAVFLRQGHPEQTLRMIDEFLRLLCQMNLPQHVVETYLLSLADSAKDAGWEADFPSLRSQMLLELAAGGSAQAFTDAVAALWKEILYHGQAGQGTPAEAYRSIREYMRAHYNEELTLQSIADQFHFSPEYVSRLFKRLDGQPPTKYLTALRIEEAKRLIRDSAYLNLRMVAELVGYPDAHYFSRIFRKATGMTPTEYKQTLP